MESKLIDIPTSELDEIINKNIEKSEKVLIVVSFIFEKGLSLILDKLTEFHSPKNITIITSNYLKSTEPKALRKLLELKSLGTKIYLFDSLTSKENFHIKSYYFENTKNNFFSCIIGSSNISFSAFRLSHELNVEIRDKKISEEYKEKMTNILSSPHLLDLTEQVIQIYEEFYEENKNMMLKSEDVGPDDINEIQFEEANVVQKEALIALKKSRDELNQDKGLVVMATGMGKTILSALDVKELNPKISSKDPLNFVDSKKYSDRLNAAKEKTNLTDAVRTAVGKSNGKNLVLACMDFAFIGGSMGSVVGEKIARAADYALKNRLPFMIISKSGGARMMEAALSLMQLVKTSSKLAQLADANIPYISLCTDPTTGGTTASFAMLGDINISEPGALIAFAGPRVVRDTTGKELPEGFQTAEFLLEHGFLDRIVERKNLKQQVNLYLDLILNQPVRA